MLATLKATNECKTAFFIINKTVLKWVIIQLVCASVICSHKCSVTLCKHEKIRSKILLQRMQHAD